MKHLLTLTILFAAMSLFAQPLTPGQPAPTLTITTDDGAALDLGDLYAAGPVLIYFYPKADTPGCTAQACNLRDNFADLQDAGIRVLGVSSDTVAKQAAFRSKYQLPFSLIADTERELAKAFGVGTIMGLVNQRQSFLVMDGKVVWRDLSAKPATQTQDALAAFAAESTKQ
jgi:thioredoxin-dependent peroxiredoxin